MSNVIQTYRLCKRLGGRALLTDVELHVPQGRIYGFLGPNGAGKTTVMKLLTNLWKPTSGEIELFGAPLKSDSCEVFRRMGSIIEFPAFFDRLTARENLRLHCDYMGYYSPGAVEEALGLLHLSADADRRVRGFSLGMRQRLGLARAVLTKPELLILDEPANGLDVVGMKQIRELLQMLCRDWGTTVLFSSHLLSAACALEELQARNFKVMDGNVIRIYEAPMAPEELFHALALRNVAVASFQKHAQTLEDYYLKMTGEGQ